MEITQTILQREAARLNKNFSLADLIRDQLRANGIEVFDQVVGTYRKASESSDRL
jgi:cysteinyl-tRNA synthetase